MTSLPKNFAPDRLARLAPGERFRLLENTKCSSRVSDSDRPILIDAIRSSGPIYDGTAIKHDDPMSLKMEEIIQSDEGRAGCLKATAEGLPALAGIEPAIVAEIGPAYGAHNMSTNRSGFLVGTLMISLGYEAVRQIPMPKGSVAQTATFWAKRR